MVRQETHFEFQVKDADSGQRVDYFLFNALNFSNHTASENHYYTRSRIAACIREGRLKINGNPELKPSNKVRVGDVLSFFISDESEVDLLPQSMEFNVLYEDRDVLVINKPVGLVIHPGAGNSEGTLVNGLLHRYDREFSQVGHPVRPGIVHRLDKDTSGVMVVALNQTSYQKLSEQLLPPRKMSRTYVALSYLSQRGERLLDKGPGELSFPIGRHPSKRKMMTVVEEGSGRASISRYRTLEYYDKAVKMELKLETGRTHQIRVHLSHVGLPVLGDKLYGLEYKRSFGDARVDLALRQLEGHALHARMLSFIHPVSKKRLSFNAPEPASFKFLEGELKRILKK